MHHIMYLRRLHGYLQHISICHRELAEKNRKRQPVPDDVRKEDDGVAHVVQQQVQQNFAGFDGCVRMFIEDNPMKKIKGEICKKNLHRG